MVACFVRDEEVVGSNPATPTRVIEKASTGKPVGAFSLPGANIAESMGKHPIPRRCAVVSVRTLVALPGRTMTLKLAAALAASAVVLAAAPASAQPYGPDTCIQGLSALTFSEMRVTRSVT